MLVIKAWVKHQDNDPPSLTCDSAEPRTRLLTATAAERAAKTAWPGKVRALGRVLAAGLIADDDAEIDMSQLALTAMAEMERPHVLLLDLLAHYAVVSVEEDPRNGKFLLDFKPSAEAAKLHISDQQWIPDWRPREILVARPQLSQALTSVIGLLQLHGLVVLNRYRSYAWSATDLGLQVLDYYIEAAEDIG